MARATLRTRTVIAGEKNIFRCQRHLLDGERMKRIKKNGGYSFEISRPRSIEQHMIDVRPVDKFDFALSGVCSRAGAKL